MPAELRLQFNRLQGDPAPPLDAPVPVTVHLMLDGNNAGDTECFDFVNPLDDKVLGELRWYIERYPSWPVGPDYTRAEQLETTLPRWGHQLFDAIFQRSANAMRLLANFDANRGKGGLLTIDSTEPRILRLPWELLADEGGYLFSKRPPVSIRRRLHRTRHLPLAPFTLPVRILMVVSRPDGADFIDPRSSATPLLDAVEDLAGQMVVEFLRPPTLAALTRRLRDDTLPPVHVLHFDGHGVYDPIIGLGRLFFEDEQYQCDPVDAEKLGTLLNESKIPLVLLEACQSATPDERNPFGSVAARLIEAGMGGVIAMNYSVLVETSKRLVGHFYAALATGQPVSVALDQARFELLADTKRFTLYRGPTQGKEIIHLQDWFVPALYQQEQELQLVRPQELGTLLIISEHLSVIRLPRQPERAGFPPPPHHGFHGRARELLDLDRTFARQSIVLLHGFGGQGKTSLATYAAEWLVRTGRFARAAFVSFEGGGGLELTLRELGNALVSDNFALQTGDPIAAIGAALAAIPTLVVWDNLESILANGDVALPGEALQELLAAAATWFAPTMVNLKSKIQNAHSALLITTRDPALPHAAFVPGRTCRHHLLAGLHPPDALDLAATILADHNLARPPREQLAQLITFLGHHPFSLQLVLPQLRQTPDVATIVNEFETLLPGFKQGAGQERNQSLQVSLTFSLRRLGMDVQQVLPRLAVFAGRAFENDLLAITQINPTLWQRVRPELENAALISVEQFPSVKSPFLRFHPTLAPFLAHQLPADERSELESRYWQHYYAVADFIYHEDFKSPFVARSLAQCDLPNLYRGLTLALQAGALDEAVDFANSINRFLDYFGRWRERDVLNAQVAQAVAAERRTTDDDHLTPREFLLLQHQGELLLQQRAAEAERLFRSLLVKLEVNAIYDTSYHRMLTLGSIGRSLELQGKSVVAADAYRSALELANALAQNDRVKRMTGVFHTDLATVLQHQGLYAAAHVEYDIGLQLAKQVRDERQVGVIGNQMGALALAQGQLAKAQRCYTEALTTFRRLGETQTEGGIWHQLGKVAVEAWDWDEAEHCFKESLIIEERLDDKAGMIKTSNALAVVNKNAGRIVQAIQWSERALVLAEEVKDEKEISIIAGTLANLLLYQDRLAEAEAYAQRACAIMETLDLSVEPWKIYSILAGIAGRRNDGMAARAWRRKEQETFATFAGNQRYVEQYQSLIEAIAHAVDGDQQAKQFVEVMYAKLEVGSAAWAIGATSIRRILAGERDLDILTDGLERVIALIVRSILAALR